MRRVVGGLALALVAAGCSSHSSVTSTRARTASTSRRHVSSRPRRMLISPLGLPRVHSRVVPGYLLIADRNNNRALIISPSKRIVWQDSTLRGPDDAFFTPGYRSVITNEEFNDTLVELSLKSHRRVWTYGHAGVARLEPRVPEHARRRLPAAVRNHHGRRHPELPHRPDQPGEARRARPRRQLRARPASRLREPERRHAPPGRRAPRDRDRRLDRPARPVGQPALVDPLAGALPLGRAAAPERAGARGELRHPRTDRDREPQRRDHLVVRRQQRAEPARQAIARGALAERADRRERRLQPPRDRDRPAHQADRVAVRAHRRRGPLARVPRQAGRDRPAPGDRPRADDRAGARRGRHPCRPLRVSRIGSLPQAVSRLAAVALPDGRVLALGGLVGGTSSEQVLLGRPERMRAGGAPAGGDARRRGSARRAQRVPLRRRPGRLERRGRPREHDQRRLDERGEPRRAALGPRCGEHRPDGLPRRRVHGHALRDGRPALPAGSPAHCGGAPPRRPALRGRRRARREDLRRGRAHGRRSVAGRVPGRPGDRRGRSGRDAPGADGARGPCAARLAPPARGRRLAADPRDRPARRDRRSSPGPFRSRSPIRPPCPRATGSSCSAAERTRSTRWADRPRTAGAAARRTSRGRSSRPRPS